MSGSLLLSFSVTCWWRGGSEERLGGMGRVAGEVTGGTDAWGRAAGRHSTSLPAGKETACHRLLRPLEEAGAFRACLWLW